MAQENNGNLLPQKTPGETILKEGGKRSAPPARSTISAAEKAEIDAKIKEIESKCIQSRKDLAAYFGPERWPKIEAQARSRGFSDEDITSVCGSLMMTRAEWETVKGRPKAALILAANHLLIAVGSRPSNADEKALDNALNEQPTSATAA